MRRAENILPSRLPKPASFVIGHSIDMLAQCRRIPVKHADWRGRPPAYYSPKRNRAFLKSLGITSLFRLTPPGAGNAPDVGFRRRGESMLQLCAYSVKQS